MYISPKQEFLPDPPSTTRDKWSRRFQYLYFLRFSLIGWWLLPVMCGVDAFSGLSSLTRGIMTLSTGWQAFHTMFFVVTLCTTTLVCARNIVMNGNFRFASEPPVRLYKCMTSCETRTLLAVLAISQIPAAITLWYVARTTIDEQVGFPGADLTTWPYGGWHMGLWLGYAGGLAAAFFFWYLVTLFYLWTHEWNEGDGPRALIFPTLLPRVERAMQAASKPQLAEWLENILRRPLKLTHLGYAPSSKGKLWELHFLSAVSLIAFVLLYLFLYPVVSPVVTTTHPQAQVALAAAIIIAVLLGARKTGSRWRMEPPGFFFALLFVALLACFVCLLLSDIARQDVWLDRSFPVLASLTVLMIFLQWAINGASFLFDRYRVPVLTSVIALVFLPKLAVSFLPMANCAPLVWVQTHLLDWDADHYFEVRQTMPVTELPTPIGALKKTLERLGNTQAGDAGDPPLVIITATGGGIQAAEWTAQVLARLEEDFREDSRLHGYQLHDHVLLASGVSGGSVGLVPYLLEYTAPPGVGFPTGAELRSRLTVGPGCSSLEAVAWGLEYYDLQRLALTFRFPFLQAAQDSPKDPGTLVAPDRTWALSRALNRNLTDPQCGVSPATAKLPDAEEITLGKAAAHLRGGTMPAFTLNTTVAESGGRFLLSNYSVPRGVATHPPNTEFLPAESFLQAYAQDTCCANGPHGEKLYADLPLATASRMSATFPVVSSATRVPRPYARAASHFLDGGYFDNDGTASAIEFLYSAMNQRTASQPEAGQPAPAVKPLKVLLVEIRDGEDLNPNVAEDDLNQQAGGNPPPAAWWTFDQMLGPLEGLWNAGHVSVTRRNRRELCVLETAYKDTLILHHVIFAIPQEHDRNDKPKPAPLSWKLTASQLAYISSVAHGNQASATNKAVESAIRWIAEAQQSKPPAPEVCSVDNAPSPVK